MRASARCLWITDSLLPAAKPVCCVELKHNVRPESRFGRQSAPGAEMLRMKGAMDDKRPNRPSTQQLKAIWMNRLRAAELDLKLAQDRLQDARANLKPGDLSVSDALSAHRQASQAEVQALSEYERVLRIVRDLEEHGKIPESDSSASSGDEGK